MTHDDIDLKAIRRTLSARTEGTEDSLSRTWAVIAQRQAATRRGPAPAVVVRPMRWLAPVGAAATVVAVAVGLPIVLGSGDGGPLPPTQEPLGDLPRITSPEQIQFPIDDYGYTNEGYLHFQAAGQHLRGQCLQRFGVEVEPVDLVVLAQGLPDFDGQHQRLYGVFDRELASERGYRAPGGPSSSPQHQFRQPPSEADEHLALLLRGPDPAGSEPDELPRDANGDPLPAGGCDGEVDRALFGEDTPEPDQRITNNDSWVRAHGDPRVQAADAAWSECMRRAGYEYGSYGEAMGDRYDTPEVTQAEIAEAVANVDCKVATNLVGVLVGVTSQLQEEYIAERWDELQQLKQWYEALYHNSVEVLRAAGLVD